MTTTYTVFRTEDSGDAERGLSLEEAADALLSVDGRVYQIMFEDGAFEIHRSAFSRHSPGGAGPLRPVRAGGRFLHPSLRALYAAVLADEWNGRCAMTDAEFDAMIAAATADEAED